MNEAPVASNDTAAAAEDAQVVITVLADDIDPDGDAFAAGTVRDAPLHRPVTVQADMTLLYVPGRDFDGSDIFVRAVSDGRISDEESVTVNEVDDQPKFAAAVTRRYDIRRRERQDTSWHWTS